MRVEDQFSERKLLKLLLFGLSSTPKLRVKKVSSFDGKLRRQVEDVPKKMWKKQAASDMLTRSTMQRG
jgi:hypothetical protein